MSRYSLDANAYIKNKELVFHASRTKALLLLVCSVFFVASGWWMKEQKPFIGWSSIVFFGLAILPISAMFLPGMIYLRLDQDGFETSSMGRKFKTRWEDVESFELLPFRGTKIIAIKYRTSYANQKIARAVARTLFGVEGTIPNSYNVPRAELVRILNQWLARFGRIGTRNSNP